ncbi:MAG: hypothetical protein WC551_11475 [Patescibacteria group bacterium]
MNSFPPLDLFMLEGLAEGHAAGKPQRIAEAKIDHVWEAAQELRDAPNYINGRLDQAGAGEPGDPTRAPGPKERACLITARAVGAIAYRVLAQAREYQRRGE